jgi:GlpG protein
MRQIGHVAGEGAARAFGDYLYAQGIENQIEADRDGTWAVWIHSEEELERAKGMLADFREHPADPKFQDAAPAARRLREQKEKESAAREKRLKDRRYLFRPLTGYGAGPLTLFLIAASVVVYLFSLENRDLLLRLFISESDPGVAGLQRLTDGLLEIRHGEVWRLITPIFIHFGLMHIFFNMLWLLDLGSMIEARQKTWVLAVLVLVIAAVSNLAQYVVGGPGFGGMSGVVYGLLGYVWIRGKFDPGSGLFVHPTNVTLMIIWFFICFTGQMGDIANMAHAAGLVMGMAWGYLSSLRHR